MHYVLFLIFIFLFLRSVLGTIEQKLMQVVETIVTILLNVYDFKF